MLKADFHIHTKEDPKDSFRIRYTAKGLIDFASLHKYEVIAITNHDQVIYNKDLNLYAKEKGILLIPGIEKTINGKHVLIYNVTQEEADKVKKISDVQILRKNGALVIAPHPFFFFSFSLGKEFTENIDCFDAVEFSAMLHTFFSNENKKAVKIAERYKKPLVGNSDAHSLHEMNKTYSLLDCKKDVKSVLEAIKKNKIQIVTQRTSVWGFTKSFVALILAGFKKVKENLLG